MVRGFRSLDKDLLAFGIRSCNSALYRPGKPITFPLVTAMIDGFGVAGRNRIRADRRSSPRDGAVVRRAKFSQRAFRQGRRQPTSPIARLLIRLGFHHRKALTFS